jgi:DNA-binding MarR family transcriptional regulator
MSEHRTARADRHGQLRVLEALDGAGNVSQRELAEEVGLAPSQVNRIIRSLVTQGHLRVTDDRVRPFAYALTGGRTHLRRLSHARYDAVVKDFLRVRRRIAERLALLRRDGVPRVALYGAGEILALARPLVRAEGVGGGGRGGRRSAAPGQASGPPHGGSPDAISAAAPDAVVITSFRHADRIRQRLESTSAGARVVEL